ncbi:arsenate reductase ArsC [Pseudaestuariivita sp.]|uniref:arsenate reductase ArsC n=1 Tax=Pseudaestuariivita sp. TaxID=2211669 RepID=UPI004059BAA9
MNVLVLCSSNSARSILLESIFNTHGKGRVTAYSAGSQPAGQVHPQSLKLLAAKGIDTAHAASKSWDVFAAPEAPTMDMVITVCDTAAAEAPPIWPGAPVCAHWGVEDPAAADASEWEATFNATYDKLKLRARELLAQPFEAFDTPELKATLDRIAATA